MKKMCLTLALTILFFAVSAQDILIRPSLSLMMPLRRTLIGVEVCERIAPRYTLSMLLEVSATESIVTPKIAYSLGGLSVDLGMGWGHRWQKEGCCDHNYHTYLLGVTWTKRMKGISLFVSPTMMWRTYQSHIGLHKGAMKISAGVIVPLRKKRNK